MPSLYVPPTDWIPDFIHRSPAYNILQDIWTEIRSVWPSIHDLNQYMPPPYMLVPQGPKSDQFEHGYVVQIVQEHQIQTRTACWHDFFNALTWAAFPHSKQRLNLRMYHSILQRHEQGDTHRSHVENIGTLIDENGIVIASSCKTILELIRTFQWKELFWERRSVIAETCEPFLFGHALLEKCLNPYIGMTGHAILWHVEECFFRQSIVERRLQVDQMLASCLENPNALRKTRDLSPFPLLGYPGYYEAANRESFYDNTHYFRPGRRGTS
ncbi:MAG: DUF3025 domain-containing protein [Myxococcota bacterium]|nr:DUF3025 domain-containing protein [Myxococcota bacterium]